MMIFFFFVKNTDLTQKLSKLFFLPHLTLRYCFS